MVHPSNGRHIPRSRSCAETARKPSTTETLRNKCLCVLSVSVVENRCSCRAALPHPPDHFIDREKSRAEGQDDEGDEQVEERGGAGEGVLVLEEVDDGVVVGGE